MHEIVLGGFGGQGVKVIASTVEDPDAIHAVLVAVAGSRELVGRPPPFASAYDRALWAMRTWLDSWAGVGHIAVGMHRQGFDLQLTQYDERGWRATFYTTGMEHSPTSATGTGWERTPWHAVQRAAWEGGKS